MSRFFGCCIVGGFLFGILVLKVAAFFAYLVPVRRSKNLNPRD